MKVEEIKSKIQKEVLEKVEPGCRHRYLLAPRVGKTKIGVDTIKKLNPKSILWVTLNVTTAKEAILKEMKVWGAKKYLPCLEITSWNSLKKFEGDYDLIILDEEQKITPTNTLTLVTGKLKAHTLISLTGTVSAYSDVQDIITSLGLTIGYEISIKKAVDLGLLADYKIKVIKVGLSKENTLAVKSKKSEFFTSETASYKYLSKKIQNSTNPLNAIYRKRLIATCNGKRKAILKLQNNKGRKMFFCYDKNQTEMFEEKYRYHSTTADQALIDFCDNKNDTIALVNKGGVGATYEAVDHLILTQVDSDNTGLTTQKICRTLLAQSDYKAIIWILCARDTKDEDWLANVLVNFHEEKIEIIDSKL